MDANGVVGRAAGFPLKLAGTKNGRVGRKHDHFLLKQPLATTPDRRSRSPFSSAFLPTAVLLTTTTCRFDLLPKLVVAKSGPFSNATICRVKDRAEFPRMSQEQPLHMVECARIVPDGCGVHMEACHLASHLDQPIIVGCQYRDPIRRPQHLGKERRQAKGAIPSEHRAHDFAFPRHQQFTRPLCDSDLKRVRWRLLQQRCFQSFVGIQHGLDFVPQRRVAARRRPALLLKCAASAGIPGIPSAADRPDPITNARPSVKCSCTNLTSAS